MKPFYWESHHGNFGDDLNLWLWDFLIPGFREVHDETLLVGVGTVLNKALLPPAIHKLVIGSGFGYGAMPDLADKSEWDVRCVRGPLTAEKAGLPTEFGIIDPAVMVSEMPEFKNLPKSGKKTFVPHWESAIAGLWPEICGTVGLSYLDPRGDAKEVISEIARSELIVAESMHGAILADAFRVPWVAVSTSRSINNFKWNDWAMTLGVTYAPRHVPISTRAEAIIKGARFWGVEFSRDNAVEDPNKREFDETLTRTRADPQATSMRSAAKRLLAAPSTLALWQASKATPQLSTDAALAERKARFNDVLNGIRRDYL